MQDHRIQDLIGKDSHCKIAIISYPFDEGVAVNGGRVGAALAPALILKHFLRLTPPLNSRIIEKTCLIEGKKVLKHQLYELFENGIFPIVLGGGHETSFAHFEGYKNPCHIVNFDAHPDVRPLKEGRGHSGSPFFQALNAGALSYTVAGLNEHSCAKDHLDFLHQRGCRSYFYPDLGNCISSATFPTLFSFDMDVVNAAFAPGVSAPNVLGIDPLTACTLAEAIGKSQSASSFDLVEVNPHYDTDERTCRLAARILWSVIKGLCTRMSHVL